MPLLWFRELELCQHRNSRETQTADSTAVVPELRSRSSFLPNLPKKKEVGLSLTSHLKSAHTFVNFLAPRLFFLCSRASVPRLALLRFGFLLLVFPPLFLPVAQPLEIVVLSQCPDTETSHPSLCASQASICIAPQVSPLGLPVLWNHSRVSLPSRPAFRPASPSIQPAAGRLSESSSAQSLYCSGCAAVSFQPTSNEVGHSACVFLYPLPLPLPLPPSRCSSANCL